MDKQRFTKKDFFIGQSVKLKNVNKQNKFKKGIVKKIGNKYLDLTVGNKNVTFELSNGWELGKVLSGFSIAETEKEMKENQEREGLLRKVLKYDYFSFQGLTNDQLKQVIAVFESKEGKK